MTARETSEQLSVAEFVALCSLVDISKPRTEMVYGTGVMGVAGQRVVRRFEVLSVEETESGKRITVLLGNERAAYDVPRQRNLRWAA